ncbi:unnamed protein product, partial [Ectocarpus fasciculatus]
LFHREGPRRAAAQHVLHQDVRRRLLAVRRGPPLPAGAELAAFLVGGVQDHSEVPGGGEAERGPQDALPGRERAASRPRPDPVTSDQHLSLLPRHQAASHMGGELFTSLLVLAVAVDWFCEGAVRAWCTEQPLFSLAAVSPRLPFTPIATLDPAMHV